MRKYGLFILTTLLVLIFLAGCGKSLEDQIETGIANVETTFKEEPLEPNNEIGSVKVFLPEGYTIEVSEDESNYLLKKGDQQLILFVNPNEQINSQLLYELYKENQAKEIVKEKTIQTENRFGFAAILKNDENSYELIVNSGGVKVSTLTGDKNMDQTLQEMMQIAHSVSF